MEETYTLAATNDSDLDDTSVKALAVMMRNISSTGLFFSNLDLQVRIALFRLRKHCIGHGFSRYDEEHVFHSYYQWVPLVLVLQAAFCYLPW